MFDLTTYVKKWRIRQLKTVFSTLDTLCRGGGLSHTRLIPNPRSPDGDQNAQPL